MVKKRDVTTRNEYYFQGGKLSDFILTTSLLNFFRMLMNDKLKPTVNYE